MSSLSTKERIAKLRVAIKEFNDEKFSNNTR